MKSAEDEKLEKNSLNEQEDIEQAANAQIDITNSEIDIQEAEMQTEPFKLSQIESINNLIFFLSSQDNMLLEGRGLEHTDYDRCYKIVEESVIHQTDKGILTNILVESRHTLYAYT